MALGRVALAPYGVHPGEPILPQRGAVTVAADLRLPEQPDDEAAHDTLFDSLERDAFPDGLDGDFAVAVWNSSRNELTLARDRVGIRPLFFARSSDGGLVFASFSDALVESGVVEGRFQPEPLALSAMGAAQDGGPETVIEGVYRLLPGHVMTLGPQGERLRRYWQYPVHRVTRERGDHASIARALRSQLERAVGRALPPSGPIFTHLSGGLDSATVTALAARLSGRPPAEITAAEFTLPESYRKLGAIVEEPTGRSVASMSGVAYLSFPDRAVEELLLGPLARTFVVSDHPDYSYNCFVALAATKGADRVMCGFGGDEAASYNGRDAVLDDFLGLRWLTLWRLARELPGPFWRVLASQAATAFLPPHLDERLRRSVKGSKPYRLLLAETVTPRYRGLRRWSWPPVNPARIQRARLTKAAFFDRLELQAWQAARRGLRYVFPMLDWRLLEFTATVPARLQMQGGMGRALFRAAVADLLPDEVVWGSKQNVVPPLVYQLALHRKALIDEAKRVAGSEAASAVIDVSEIERRLDAIPDPEAVADAIRTNGAKSRTPSDIRAISLFVPFLVARALARNEADCAARGRPRHVAA